MMIINLFEVAVCPTCCHSSVLRRIFAGGPAAGAGHIQTLRHTTPGIVATDPAGVGTTGAQSTAWSTVTHDRPAGVAKPINDY